MLRPIRIFYVGTYEHDYPRNVLTIAALRHAGFSVRELNQSVWSNRQDKMALLDSPRALIGVGCRMVLSYVRLMRKLVANRGDVDLIVFGYIGQLDLLVLGPLARAFRAPILFDPLITLTDTLIEDRGKVGKSTIAAIAIHGFDRFALRLADIILADTEENRTYMALTFDIPADRVFVVPVGADERFFTPKVETGPDAQATLDGAGVRTLRPRRTPGDSKLKVLFYGTMIPLQGVETIVRAAKLLEHELDIAFEIIGSGQTHPAVARLVDQLEVQNVTLSPRVPYRDLPHRIEEADIVLGIFGATAKAGRVVPNKVYQAMAMSAAIVTRDSPAVRRLLRDGESALLIPPDDPVSLADAIRRLRDGELRCRLGCAARTRFLEMASLRVRAVAVQEAVEAAVSTLSPSSGADSL